MFKYAWVDQSLYVLSVSMRDAIGIQENIGNKDDSQARLQACQNFCRPIYLFMICKAGQIELLRVDYKVG